MHYITELDFSILHAMAQYLHTPLGDAVMPLISRLANGGFIWLGVAVVLLFFKKYRRYVPYYLATLALCFLVGEGVMKHLVARPRPFRMESIALLIREPGGYSFPSGHSMASFGAAVFLCHMKKSVGIAFLVLAGIIAFSRLYLMVHFPSDVLAGSMLGVGIGLLVSGIDRHVLRKKGGNCDV